jgi:peptidoglycan/xylan/chitin deacetylase (PgdA/CDA1 family)
MYHQVLPDAREPVPGYKLIVSVKTFKRQMRFLKNNRYNVLPLEKLADLIRSKKRIPARTVAITFDDGYIDNYLYAFPIFKKYNLPVTIFLIMNEIGHPGDSLQGGRLGWEEIKIMRDSGLITFGSHCLGPEPLTDIKSESQIKKEIFDSKKILQDKLGSQVSMFSYPGGRFNARIRQLVEEAGYKLAVATSPGLKYPDDDVLALKRLRISENSANLFVFWVETSGFYTFIKEHRDAD